MTDTNLTDTAHRCEHLDHCGFFKKYSETKDLACKGFIQNFCTGPKQAECKRKQYRRERNAAPPDDMMPNGCMISPPK